MKKLIPILLMVAFTGLDGGPVWINERNVVGITGGCGFATTETRIATVSSNIAYCVQEPANDVADKLNQVGKVFR